MGLHDLSPVWRTARRRGGGKLSAVDTTIESDLMNWAITLVMNGGEDGCQTPPRPPTASPLLTRRCLTTWCRIGPIWRTQYWPTGNRETQSWPTGTRRTRRLSAPRREAGRY